MRGAKAASSEPPVQSAPREMELTDEGAPARQAWGHGKCCKSRHIIVPGQFTGHFVFLLTGGSKASSRYFCHETKIGAGRHS